MTVETPAETGHNGGAEYAPTGSAFSKGSDVHRQSLHDNLTHALALPPDAVAWLLSIWDVTQVFDDMADGDFPDRGELSRAIWAALVGMPSNPFFIAKAPVLLPMVGGMVLKWEASDTVEKDGEPDERSYMWRAGFYDVVLWVVFLCHGDEAARRAGPAVMRLYGETLGGYIGEFV